MPYYYRPDPYPYYTREQRCMSCGMTSYSGLMCLSCESKSSEDVAKGAEELAPLCVSFFLWVRSWICPSNLPKEECENSEYEYPF